MKGFAAGLFRGIKQTTDKVIDINMKEMSSAKQYMKTRKDQEEKRMRDEEDRYAEAIKDLSAFVDRDSLPEGATAFDVAGAYFDTALGGSVKQAEAAVVELVKARNSLGSDSAKLIMNDAGQLGLSARDIAKKYVKPMDLEYIRGSDQFGMALPFMDKVNITDRAAESVGLPEQKQMEKLNLGTAGTKGKFVTREEYARKKRIDELQLEKAVLGNQKARKEVAEYGALDDNQIQEGFDRSIETMADAKAIPFDTVNRRFNLKTADDKYDDALEVYTTSLSNLTKTLVDSGSFGVGTNDSTIKGIANQVKAFMPNQVPPKEKSFDNMKIGNMYTVKINNEVQQILWTGDSDKLFRVD